MYNKGPFNSPGYCCLYFNQAGPLYHLGVHFSTYCSAPPLADNQSLNRQTTDSIKYHSAKCYCLYWFTARGIIVCTKVGYGPCFTWYHLLFSSSIGWPQCISLSLQPRLACLGSLPLLLLSALLFDAQVWLAPPSLSRVLFTQLSPQWSVTAAASTDHCMHPVPLKLELAQANHLL